MLLLFDADDTLWENNIYFERVIEQFIDFVNHRDYSRQAVRDILNDIEQANAALHGYGSASFARNLQQAYRHLAAPHLSETDLEYVAALAAAIARQELEIIDGVPETLAYLAGRHRLALVTKGCEEEQRTKIRRSGLRDYFCDCIIAREKTAATYEEVVRKLDEPAHESWMIGNSPRSDVNPALAAGLNAVWVPHTATWVLEREELRPAAGKLMVVERFGDLRQHF